MTILRLKQYIDYRGISVSSIEQQIGAGDGVLRKAFSKKSDIKMTWLEKISENYPDLNMNWLITGKGSMLHTKEPEKLSDGIVITPLLHRYLAVDFKYNTSSLLNLPQVTWAVKKEFQNVDKDDFIAFEMVGDSMTDKSPKSLIDGDILLGKRSSNIEVGKIYAFIYNNQSIIVIVKALAEQEIQCEFYNSHFEEVKLQKNEIKDQFNIIQLSRDRSF